MLLLSLIFIQTGCKKLVEVEAPPTASTSENVYTNDATAAAVLTGIYTNLSSNSYRFVTGSGSLSVEAGLSSDELTLAGGVTNSNSTLVRFYVNGLTKNDDTEPWTSFYSCLLPINTVIRKLNASADLTPIVKQRLLGEAKFIRAFCYFYLVNLYGDVPLALTDDYRINSTIEKTPKDKVYEQIVSDLEEAKTLLSDIYVGNDIQNVTSERIRPNKWAASALLARVYLYQGKWVNAESEASLVIDNLTLFGLTSLSQVFLKNSKEAIWQLQPVNADRITEDARLFVINSVPGNLKPVYLSTYLTKAFDSIDARRKEWVKDTVFSSVSYSYPSKYKSFTTQSSFSEYLMVLRLAEQYLIRAEAKAQQNNLSAAITDLDKIRQRASLTLIADTNPGISKAALLTTILHERQVELFTEWGHRWFDLKRTNTVDALMSVVTPLKGGTWNSNFALFPIPLYDIRQNLNLTQNAGY